MSAPRTTPSTALWLRAWHDDLRELRATPRVDGGDGIYDDQSLRIVWLQVSTPEANDNRIVEGLCLLNLLARVDFLAWRREVLALWDEIDVVMFMEAMQDLSYTLPPTVGEELHWRVGLSVPIREMEDRRLLYNEDAPSESFVSVWQKLTERLDPGSIAAAERLRMVPMLVVFDAERREEVRVGVMRTTPSMPTAKAFRRHRLELAIMQRNPGKPLAVIHAVLFCAVKLRRVRDYYLNTISRLLEVGISIINLPQLHISRKYECTAHIQALLNVPARKATPQNRTESVATLRSLVVSSLQPQRMAAILSAVEVAPSLKSVIIKREIDDPMDTANDDEKLVQHLAYSLFSRHATHTLEALELSVDYLTSELVAEMRRIMDHEDPLGILFDVPKEPGNDPKQIASRRFCLVDPAGKAYRDGRFSKALCKSMDPITVRVIQPHNTPQRKWWHVFLPSWGEAWVKNADVIQLHEEEMIPVQQSTKSFKAITIDRITDDSMHVALDLLGLIGRETHSLTVLDQRGGAVFDGWCRTAFETCPQLTELTLRMVNVQDLRVFVDASAAGQSKLHKLALDSITPRDEADVQTFLLTLCDPRHALTTHLKQVSLGFRLAEANTAWVVDPLLRVVRENTSLSKIAISFDAVEGSHVNESDVEAQFAQALQHRSFVTFASVEMARKLAFLSVVDHPQLGPASIHRLDGSVVGSIFKFASYGRTRDFSIRFQWRSTAVWPEVWEQSVYS